LADYLKIPEVARRLDVSEPTVRRMVKGGKLPSVFIGGAYRVSEADLEEFLENAKVEPGKVQAPPHSEPSLFNGLEEERRTYGSRVWERINSLERTADQWQQFVDEGLYDLKRLDLETLKIMDAASLAVVLEHGPQQAGMKRAATDEQRERLEQAERRLIDTNLEFWARVENELAQEEVADFEAFKARREEWEQASKNSRIA
jgi:excisionase family DNA binding protein